MFMDMCLNKCVDMCAGMRTGMCADMHIDVACAGTPVDVVALRILPQKLPLKNSCSKIPRLQNCNAPSGYISAPFRNSTTHARCVGHAACDVLLRTCRFGHAASDMQLRTLL